MKEYEMAMNSKRHNLADDQARQLLDQMIAAVIESEKLSQTNGE
jgi:hypothetical protein